RDLVWAFVYPEGVRKTWGIRAVSGRVKGLGGFERPDIANYPGVPRLARPAAMVTQTHPASELRPGQQYLIWFEFQTTRPVDMQIAINLVPPEDNKGSAEALGLK